MTELTLEALQSALEALEGRLEASLQRSIAPLREESAFIRRSIVALQQETRSLRAVFNDFALTNPTSGEIQALHDDVNRVQAENVELQLRLDAAERLIRELRGDR